MTKRFLNCSAPTNHSTNKFFFHLKMFHNTDLAKGANHCRCEHLMTTKALQTKVAVVSAILKMELFSMLSLLRLLLQAPRKNNSTN